MRNLPLSVTVVRCMKQLPHLMGNRLADFLSKIDRTGNGCWPWLGYKKALGYGQYSGKKYLAHRLAYRTFVGPFDETKIICHKCDNPSCCNPDHLYVGTFAENSRDMVERGRISTLFAKGNTLNRLRRDRKPA